VKKKNVKENSLQDIEEALDRIACSLAGISGTLDAFYKELLLQKEAEHIKPVPEEPVAPFFHEE